MKTTVGDYLIRKIQGEAIQHVFGVPGDYMLNFCQMMEKSSLTIVNTCDEQGAGFAADAYARLHGLGIVCVTYNVGGFKILNCIGQAYAEKSPVIVIAGAPTTVQQENDRIVHHRIKEFNDQFTMFERVTVVATKAARSAFVFAEIDRVFETVKKQSRPGFIEVPMDLFDMELEVPDDLSVILGKSMKLQGHDVDEETEPTLDELLEEVTTKIKNAKQPLVLAGIDISRFHLHNQMIQFIEKMDLPFVTHHLSKSVLPENHPNFLGLYEGAQSAPELKKFVEASDCLIMMGALLSDIETGMCTAELKKKNIIDVQHDKICVGYHRYNVGIVPFVHAISKEAHKFQGAKSSMRDQWPRTLHHKLDCTHEATKKLSVSRMFQLLNCYLEKNSVVIPDTGISLFGSGSEMRLPEGCCYIGSPFYASMGFAVPAALGAMFARPELRPVVLVGDGCFQMTGFEMSTILRFNLAPIVILLNNKGYVTERFKSGEASFNNIRNWNYAKFLDVIGGGKGCQVTNEGELCDALKNAFQDKNNLQFIQVELDPHDYSISMNRIKQYQQQQQQRQTIK